MADEEKIGTKVTFKDPDGVKQPVTIQGVTLAPGDEVDLAEFLEQDKAEALAKSLAANRYFAVEGGPDHEADEQRRAEARAEQAQRASQKVEEANQSPPEYQAPEQPRLEAQRTRNAKRTSPPEEE